MSLLWIDGKAARTHPLCLPSSEKVFAMLVAYLDASGTHEGSHNSVIAGYWGSVNEWRRFSRSWKAVLDSEGISEFHAKDFWPRFGGRRLAPYTDWTDERHACFIDRLLKVIETTKITPFACGVSPLEWNALSKATLEIVSSTEVERHQQALRLPLHRIIYRVTSYCLPHKAMHFVLDRDKPVTQAALLSLFDGVKDDLLAQKDDLYPRLGELTFADSKDALPLQAADLLAYEAHRYAKKADGDQHYPVRSEFGRALRRFRSVEDFWFFDQVRMTHLKRLLDHAVEEAIHETISSGRDESLQSGARLDP